MEFKNRTLQQKTKGKWQVISCDTDPGIVNKMLCDEMTIRFLFKQKKKIRKIKYTGIGIVVTFNRKLKAVYTK